MAPRIRRSLLQRLANDLAVARKREEDPEWNHLPSCCWLHFEWPEPGRLAVHRLCGDGCVHWHHQNEIWLA